jgi:hypothetical protein
MADETSTETIYSRKAQDILAAERMELLPHAGQDGADPNIMGLAISGGGIRSASFALGVLQALYGFGVFDRFHYLSTVSGGSYIGTALTYFRNTFNADSEQRKLGPDWFPFGYLRAAAGQTKAIGARVAAPEADGGDDGNEWSRRIVSYLRQHAAFLVPSRQLGLPALIAGALRGLLTTALPYFAILAGILGVLVCLGAFDRLSDIDWAKGLFPALVAEPQPAIKAACAVTPCAMNQRALPMPYLAAYPAAIGLGLAALFVLLALGISALSGVVERADRKERFGIEAYEFLITFYAWAGWGLVIGLAALLVATLPWLWEYLNYLLHAAPGEQLPGTLGALATTLGSAIALIGKMRSVLGGAEQKPSLFRNIWMSVAGIAFVYGIFLLAYAAARTLVDAPLPDGWDQSVSNWGLPPALTWPGLVLLVGLLFAFVITINHAAQHRLYRDRLMEVFCAEQTALKEGSWHPARRAQSKDGWLRNMRNVARPFHIINACIITTDSSDRRFRGRGGDNFILSPLYCGSDSTGWAKTAAYMPTLSIATAAAISGAALNAHAGAHGTGLLRNKAYAAVLTFLGLNLGYWARNPNLYERVTRVPDPAGAARDGARTSAGTFAATLGTMVGSRNDKFANLPKVKFPNLLAPGLRGISGFELDEERHFVQLSDGGHFENLAIYELIRRKVDFLWVSDAGQDGGFSFEDLSNAIERVRVDFGVHIRFLDEDYDLTHLIPDSIASDDPAEENFFKRYRVARRGYAIGTIDYPNARPGTIVYVKSTLTRGLPGDIYGYKARNDDFPHQTTLDQFFDEEQFEAYRELGYRVAARLFQDIKDARQPGGKPPAPPLKGVANLLGL